MSLQDTIVKCLLWFALLWGISNAFQVSPRQSRSGCLLQPCFSTPITTAESDEAVKQEKKSILTFEGKLSFKTEPVPTVSISKMTEFFQMEEPLTCLLSEAGKNQIESKSMTPELLEKWKTQTIKMGGEEPAETDSTWLVKTSGISFPGLKLESFANMGAKLIDTGGEHPMLQFTLISEERSVSGLPPVVWIYNKLMGASSADGSSDEEPKAKSFTTISVEETQGGEELVFDVVGLLRVDIEFPSVLLKILPTNKEKAEEQGSAAIAKALEKGLKGGVDGFLKLYKEYVSK